jgi:hypothetical protein
MPKCSTATAASEPTGCLHHHRTLATLRSEDERTIDPERCRRVDWISWVIQNAETHPGIRVFQQTTRWGETSWVHWLYEHDYTVILWERKDYYLLKTAFYPIYKRKKEELERDWKVFQAGNG